MADASALRLGEELDAGGERTGRVVAIEPSHLTTHGVIVGMTGSGKTGLAVVLLEEALSRGIPVIVLDPKGDMGNLALNFPDLRADDFRPWLDASEVARAGGSLDALAASTAARWRDGLASWGVTPDAMRRLRDTARVKIFTPGSAAGVPLDVVGALAAPPSGSAEERADAVEAFTSGLLALIGREGDPLSSPDHVLLSNLVAGAWDAGEQLDLAGLVARVAAPPFRKLGVFELDAFIPPKDRMALAARLNALLASPSFAPWRTGEPLDVGRWLDVADGRPRASIVHLAHLSEPERQFAVTLVLSRVVSWMRTQPGTSDLRALVYMDEVAGFAPPTAEPPSKKPILTILKQARAHGLGMVLATQNPVDLDYKAMSNAGTWMVGRLQTERDKARILEGLRSAAGDVDVGALGALVGGLGPRQFLLHSARGGAPRRFASRWAMSYLRGPLTRVEIERLAGGARGGAPPAAAAAGSATGASAGAGAGEPGQGAVAGEPDPGGDAGDAVAVPPPVAEGIRVRWLDPAAPWARQVGARPGSARHEAAVAARVSLRHDEGADGTVAIETFECVLFPLSEAPDPAAAHVVDHDERDLLEAPPQGAVHAVPRAPVERPAFFRTLARRLEEHLVRTRASETFVNRDLRLHARAGETREAFLARCAAAADAAADAEAAKLRETVAARRERLEKQRRAADDRVRELTTDVEQRRQHELLAGAGQLLSAFLGGRGGVRSLAGAASRRGMTRRAGERLETARGKAADVADDMEALERDLADDLAALQEKWDAVASRIETRTARLDASDVTVDELVLLWIPA